MKVTTIGLEIAKMTCPQFGSRDHTTSRTLNGSHSLSQLKL